jgi:hypothetical protein
MTITEILDWRTKKTAETAQIEKLLRDAGFEQVDAYRYNAASIRLRVIDRRFAGLTLEKRDAILEPFLEKLPEETQSDIMSLYAFTTAEIASGKTTTNARLNMEFENPSPSIL